MKRKVLYSLLYASLIIIAGFAYLHLKYSHFSKAEGLVESNSNTSGDDVMRGIEKIALITFTVNNNTYGVTVENTSLIAGERVTVLYETDHPKNAIYFSFFAAYLPTIITCIIVIVIGLAAINSFIE